MTLSLADVPAKIPAMPPWMVLIGPVEAGKTTLGKRIAEASGRQFLDLDEIADAYHAEVGWSWERVWERAAAVGRAVAEDKFEPARVYAVERAVATHSGVVMAFGAGHTSYTDKALLARVSAALESVPHVVLVVPSADATRAVEVLRERSQRVRNDDWVHEGRDFIHQWVHDPANRSLATVVFVTEGEEPAASASRLLAICERGAGR